MNTRTSWRNGKHVIPVSVPIPYDALDAAAVKGKTVGVHIPCPKCLTVGSLVYLGRWVMRWAHWPGVEGIEHRSTPLPQCRCTVCRRRRRVLPLEISPRKSYTRGVIETACATYVAAERPTITLRQTVARLGKTPPHPSALHGWLGGLGARALGRLDRQRMGPPVGALIAETAKGLRPELSTGWTHSHPIPTHKYRSPERRDRLEACARLFDAAGRLFPQAAYRWSTWEGWLQSHFHVTAWDFPARSPGPAIQHPGLRQPIVSCAPSNRDRKPRTKGNAHGARSPP